MRADDGQVAWPAVLLEAMAWIPDGVIVIDAGGRLLLTNEAARALAVADPALGSPYGDVALAWVLHYEDGGAVPVEARPLARALRGETVRDAAFRLTDAQGEVRHVLGTASAVRDAAGAVLGAVLVFRDVSEKWRAEEALRRARDELEARVLARTAELSHANAVLRESEERYRSLAEAAYDMIFIVGRSEQVEYVNSRAAAQLGRTPREVIGRRLGELVPEEDAERQRQSVRTVLETAAPLFVETRITFPTGAKWLDTRLVPLRDGGGNVRAVLGIARDATARKLAEEALRASEERFRLLVTQSPNGILEQDLELRYVAAFNPSPPLTAEEMIGKTDRDLFGEPVGAALESVKRGVLATGHPVRMELTLPVDGTDRHVSAAFHARCNPRGEILGVLTYEHDITELRAAERRLAAQNSLLEAVLQQAADGILVFDASGRVTMANPAAARIMGMRPEGTTTAELRSALSPRTPEGAELPVAARAVSRALEGTVVGAHDVAIVRPDGRAASVLLSAAPLRDAHGQIVGAVATGVDVTERRRAERFREEYVSFVSHDLRAPLTTMGVRAAWLAGRLEEHTLGPERAAAEHIVRNVNAMGGMLNDLAESARLESGQLELDLHAVDMEKLIGVTIERVVSPEDRARLRVDIAADLGAVLADAPRIERVLANFLSNAFKYAGPPARVVVAARREGAETVVSVADEGPGIPREEIPLLFERFYRAVTGRRAEGLGLGLYICRMLVEKHGGRVWVDSHVGRGSVFFFALPGPRS